MKEFIRKRNRLLALTAVVGLLLTAGFAQPAFAEEAVSENACYPLEDADEELHDQNILPEGSDTESRDQNVLPEDMGFSGEEENLMPILSIEDRFCFDGMDRSYQDGYMPRVAKGRALIVLPLKASGSVADDRITVSPQLGATERSPFIYRNYQWTFALTDEMPSGQAETVGIYLVRVELELSPDRYNGIYPIVLNVTGQSVGGMTFSQTFTTYVTITDGITTESNNEKEPEPVTVTKPQSQPLLYISDYTISPETVEAGKPFSVTIRIRNTSKTRFVQNMAIRVSTNSTDLTLREDSSTVYWEKLEADTEKELTLHFFAEKNIDVGKYGINLDMTFDNSDAVTLSAAGSVPVTVTQPILLEATFPEFARNVIAGDSIVLSFQALNLGKGRAYNVRFMVDGAGLIPNGVAFIGNMEPDSSGSADIKVFAGPKDMNRTLEKGVENYGATSGLMTMIYEDENGNEFRKEQGFSTYVEELVVLDTASKEQEKADSGQLWIGLVIGAVIILGVAAWLLCQWKKRRNFAA